MGVRKKKLSSIHLSLSLLLTSSVVNRDRVILINIDVLGFWKPNNQLKNINSLHFLCQISVSMIQTSMRKQKCPLFSRTGAIHCFRSVYCIFIDTQGERLVLYVMVVIQCVRASTKIYKLIKNRHWYPKYHYTETFLSILLILFYANHLFS